MNSMHGYNERINKINIYYKDSMNILNQNIKVTPILEYDTSPLDESIGSEL